MAAKNNIGVKEFGLYRCFDGITSIKKTFLCDMMLEQESMQ